MQAHPAPPPFVVNAAAEEHERPGGVEAVADHRGNSSGKMKAYFGRVKDKAKKFRDKVKGKRKGSPGPAGPQHEESGSDDDAEGDHEPLHQELDGGTPGEGKAGGVAVRDFGDNKFERPPEYQPETSQDSLGRFNLGREGDKRTRIEEKSTGAPAVDKLDEVKEGTPEPVEDHRRHVSIAAQPTDDRGAQLVKPAPAQLTGDRANQLVEPASPVRQEEALHAPPNKEDEPPISRTREAEQDVRPKDAIMRDGSEPRKDASVGAQPGDAFVRQGIFSQPQQGASKEAIMHDESESLKDDSGGGETPLAIDTENRDEEMSSDQEGAWYSPSSDLGQRDFDDFMPEEEQGKGVESDRIPSVDADQFQYAQEGKPDIKKPIEEGFGLGETAPAAAASAAGGLDHYKSGQDERAHRGEDRQLEGIEDRPFTKRLTGDLSTDRDGGAGIPGSEIGYGGEEVDPEVRGGRVAPITSGRSKEGQALSRQRDQQQGEDVENDRIPTNVAGAEQFDDAKDVKTDAAKPTEGGVGLKGAALGTLAGAAGILGYGESGQGGGESRSLEASEDKPFSERSFERAGRPGSGTDRGGKEVDPEVRGGTAGLLGSEKPEERQLPAHESGEKQGEGVENNRAPPDIVNANQLHDAEDGKPDTQKSDTAKPTEGGDGLKDAALGALAGAAGVLGYGKSGQGEGESRSLEASEKPFSERSFERVGRPGTGTDHDVKEVDSEARGGTAAGPEKPEEGQLPSHEGGEEQGEGVENNRAPPDIVDANQLHDAEDKKPGTEKTDTAKPTEGGVGLKDAAFGALAGAAGVLGYGESGQGKGEGESRPSEAIEDEPFSERSFERAGRPGSGTDHDGKVVDPEVRGGIADPIGSDKPEDGQLPSHVSGEEKGEGVENDRAPPDIVDANQLHDAEDEKPGTEKTDSATPTEGGVGLKDAALGTLAGVAGVLGYGESGQGEGESRPLETIEGKPFSDRSVERAERPGSGTDHGGKEVNPEVRGGTAGPIGSEKLEEGQLPSHESGEEQVEGVKNDRAPDVADVNQLHNVEDEKPGTEKLIEGGVPLKDTAAGAAGLLGHEKSGQGQKETHEGGDRPFGEIEDKPVTERSFDGAGIPISEIGNEGKEADPKIRGGREVPIASGKAEEDQLLAHERGEEQGEGVGNDRIPSSAVVDAEHAEDKKPDTEESGQGEKGLEGEDWHLNQSGDKPFTERSFAGAGIPGSEIAQGGIKKDPEVRDGRRVSSDSGEVEKSQLRPHERGIEEGEDASGDGTPLDVDDANQFRDAKDENLNTEKPVESGVALRDAAAGAAGLLGHEESGRGEKKSLEGEDRPYDEKPVTERTSEDFTAEKEGKAGIPGSEIGYDGNTGKREVPIDAGKTEKGQPLSHETGKPNDGAGKSKPSMGSMAMNTLAWTFGFGSGSRSNKSKGESESGRRDERLHTEEHEQPKDIALPEQPTDYQQARDLDSGEFKDEQLGDAFTPDQSTGDRDDHLVQSASPAHVLEEPSARAKEENFPSIRPSEPNQVLQSDARNQDTGREDEAGNVIADKVRGEQIPSSDSSKSDRGQFAEGEKQVRDQPLKVGNIVAGAAAATAGALGYKASEKSGDEPHDEDEEKALEDEKQLNNSEREVDPTFETADKKRDAGVAGSEMGYRGKEDYPEERELEAGNVLDKKADSEPRDGKAIPGDSEEEQLSTSKGEENLAFEGDNMHGEDKPSIQRPVEDLTAAKDVSSGVAATEIGFVGKEADSDLHDGKEIPGGPEEAEDEQLSTEGEEKYEGERPIGDLTAAKDSDSGVDTSEVDFVDKVPKPEPREDKEHLGVSKNAEDDELPSSTPPFDDRQKDIVDREDLNPQPLEKGESDEKLLSERPLEDLSTDKDGGGFPAAEVGDVSRQEDPGSGGFRYPEERDSSYIPVPALGDADKEQPKPVPSTTNNDRPSPEESKPSRPSMFGMMAAKFGFGSSSPPTPEPKVEKVATRHEQESDAQPQRPYDTESKGPAYAEREQENSVSDTKDDVPLKDDEEQPSIEHPLRDPTAAKGVGFGGDTYEVGFVGKEADEPREGKEEAGVSKNVEGEEVPSFIPSSDIRQREMEDWTPQPLEGESDEKSLTDRPLEDLKSTDKEGGGVPAAEVRDGSREGDPGSGVSRSYPEERDSSEMPVPAPGHADEEQQKPIPADTTSNDRPSPEESKPSSTPVLGLMAAKLGFGSSPPSTPEPKEEKIATRHEQEGDAQLQRAYDTESKGPANAEREQVNAVSDTKDDVPVKEDEEESLIERPIGDPTAAKGVGFRGDTPEVGLVGKETDAEPREGSEEAGVSKNAEGEEVPSIPSSDIRQKAMEDLTPQPLEKGESYEKSLTEKALEDFESTDKERGGLPAAEDRDGSRERDFGSGVSRSYPEERDSSELPVAAPGHANEEQQKPVSDTTNNDRPSPEESKPSRSSVFGLMAATFGFGSSTPPTPEPKEEKLARIHEGDAQLQRPDDTESKGPAYADREQENVVRDPKDDAPLKEDEEEPSTERAIGDPTAAKGVGFGGDMPEVGFVGKVADPEPREEKEDSGVSKNAEDEVPSYTPGVRQRDGDDLTPQPLEEGNEKSLTERPLKNFSTDKDISGLPASDDGSEEENPGSGISYPKERDSREIPDQIPDPSPGHEEEEQQKLVPGRTKDEPTSPEESGPGRTSILGLMAGKLGFGSSTSPTPEPREEKLATKQEQEFDVQLQPPHDIEPKGPGYAEEGQENPVRDSKDDHFPPENREPVSTTPATGSKESLLGKLGFGPSTPPTPELEEGCGATRHEQDADKVEDEPSKEGVRKPAETLPYEPVEGKNRATEGDAAVKDSIAAAAVGGLGYEASKDEKDEDKLSKEAKPQPFEGELDGKQLTGKPLEDLSGDKDRGGLAGADMSDVSKDENSESFSSSHPEERTSVEEQQKPVRDKPNVDHLSPEDSTPSSRSLLGTFAAQLGFGPSTPPPPELKEEGTATRHEQEADSQPQPPHDTDLKGAELGEEEQQKLDSTPPTPEPKEEGITTRHEEADAQSLPPLVDTEPKGPAYAADEQLKPVHDSIDDDHLPLEGDVPSSKTPTTGWKDTLTASLGFGPSAPPPPETEEEGVATRHEEAAPPETEEEGVVARHEEADAHPQPRLDTELKDPEYAADEQQKPAHHTIDDDRLPLEGDVPSSKTPTTGWKDTLAANLGFGPSTLPPPETEEGVATRHEEADAQPQPPLDTEPKGPEHGVDEQQKPEHDTIDDDRFPPEDDVPISKTPTTGLKESLAANLSFGPSTPPPPETEEGVATRHEEEAAAQPHPQTQPQPPHGVDSKDSGFGLSFPPSHEPEEQGGHEQGADAQPKPRPPPQFVEPKEASPTMASRVFGLFGYGHSKSPTPRNEGENEARKRQMETSGHSEQQQQPL